jgi:phosphoribosylanthranilate isomerase
MPNPHSPLPTVKVCGLTRIADLSLCLRLGADYLGAIVDIPRSPRSLAPAAARQLLRCAKGRGVMVTDSTDLEALLAFAACCPLAAVQLHGGQSPAFVAELCGRVGQASRLSLPRPVEVWVAVGMPADEAEARASLADRIAFCKEHAAAGAARIVLDSTVQGISGGTGVTSDWGLAAELIAACPVPVLLAGGISPANAAAALRASGSAGLDVSSGVERAPGIKSPQRLRDLFLAARSPSQ